MPMSYPQRPRRPSRPVLEELEPRLPPASDFFVVPGAAGESVAVRFDWLRREAAFNNEIGVYRVEDEAGRVAGLLPGQDGYAQAALSAARVVFSSGQGAGAANSLTFAAGDRLAFYLVSNSTSAAVRSGNPQNAAGRGPVAFFSVDGAGPDGSDHMQSAVRSDGGLRLKFEDMLGGGDGDFNDAEIGVGGNGLLTTPGQRGQSVSATFTYASREADFRNELGLFRVDDARGSVGGLLPGAPGYVQAALSSPGRQVIFGPDDEPGATRSVTLEAGAQYALYLISDATTAQLLQGNPSNFGGARPVAFFSLPGASPDGLAHADWLSPGVIGFEDLLGGGDFDFNDLVVQVQFGAPTGTPTPGPAPGPGPTPSPTPDTTPPAITARLSTDTFDPARTTPPNDTANDGITSDPAITGTVLDASRITQFRAGVDNANPATFASVLDTLRPDGTFLLDRNRLQAIAGVPLLADGVHTIRLQATDAAGNTSAVFSFTFTLDTRATATLLLDAASDTGTLGEFRTDTEQVQLVGTAEAGASVRLRRNTGTGFVDIATTFANASGQFSFTVALNAGPNAFKVFAFDAAGNRGESGATITRNSAPTVAAPIGTVSVPVDSGPSTIDLSSVFGDADNALPIVRVNTSLGGFFVQLFDNRAPLHTANFLNYANSGAYDDTFIHRSVPGFVVQGGGFQFIDGGTPNFVDTPENAPVLNEPGLPNSRGTIALAKLTGNPNSGTDEFFFNLADNVANLDDQNGGFTVFGQVVGNGQQVIDAIAALPRFNLPQFSEIPLRNNFSGTSIQDATADNLVLLTEVSRLADPLEYVVVSNDNADLVTVSVSGSQLQLTYAEGASGTATIVVRATDTDNSSVEHTFVVQVGS